MPDAAARESVSLVENDHVTIIDTSTAHRTEEGWAYGFPELSKEHREAIKNGKRIAVPGCHATGFISLVYPLIAGGILPTDYPVASFSLTSKEPLFSPIVADYYSGMLVSLPLYSEYLKGDQTPEKIHAFFEKFYEGEKFIKVMPFGSEEDSRGFLGSNNCSGWDGLQVFVTGNEDRILISSRFDNLGKGASGAAIQCLNIVLGCEEDKGLNL